MFCFFDGLVKDHDHGRQDGYTSDHSEYHALCHDDPQIKPQGKAHKAQGNEACYRRDRASDHR